MRQLALGGKALSHLVFTFGNVPRELLRDLFVEASGFGHGGQSACRGPCQQQELVRAVPAVSCVLQNRVVRVLLALGLTYMADDFDAPLPPELLKLFGHDP